MSTTSGEPQSNPRDVGHYGCVTELAFGEPRTYTNQAGNQTTEWSDGLKVVRFADGRVKIGRQGSHIRGGPRNVTVQQFATGSNPTAHIIAAFDDND